MNKLIISAFAAIISVASIGAFAANSTPHDTMVNAPAGMTHMPSTSSFSDLYHGH